jgi:hypothetical protein
LQQAIHVLGFIERNIRVVARVQDMDVQMLRRRFDDVSQTEYSGPVVYDACGEEIYDPRVAAQGFEDGEDATDFVGLEEGGEVGEGGYEDDAGEGVEGRGFGRRGDEIGGKVG